MLYSNKLYNYLNHLSGESFVASLLVHKRGDGFAFIKSDAPQFNDIRDNGEISFCPNGKTQEFSADGKWLRKNRQAMKHGRWVRTMLDIDKMASEGHHLSDRDVERFANAVVRDHLSLEDSPYQISEVSEEELLKYYRAKFSVSAGSLGNSCMRYDECQPWLKLYAKNHEAVSMVIAKQKGSAKDEVWARALLWNTEDRKFMDRIYYASEDALNAMKQYAKVNGYMRKMNQNSSDDWRDTPIVHHNEDGELVEAHHMLTIPIKMDKRNDQVPYMDTMSYLLEKEGQIYFTNVLQEGVFAYCKSTGGAYNHVRIYRCGKTGAIVRSENAYQFYEVVNGVKTSCVVSADWINREYRNIRELHSSYRTMHLCAFCYTKDIKETAWGWLMKCDLVHLPANNIRSREIWVKPDNVVTLVSGNLASGAESHVIHIKHLGIYISRNENPEYNNWVLAYYPVSLDQRRRKHTMDKDYFPDEDCAYIDGEYYHSKSFMSATPVKTA